MESQIVPGIGFPALCGRWQWYIHPLLLGLESVFIPHRFSGNVQKVSLRAACPPESPSVRQLPPPITSRLWREKICSFSPESPPPALFSPFLLTFTLRRFQFFFFLISLIIFPLLSLVSLNMTLKTSGEGIFFFFACFSNLLKFPMLKCVLSRSLYYFFNTKRLKKIFSQITNKGGVLLKISKVTHWHGVWFNLIGYSTLLLEIYFSSI